MATMTTTKMTTTSLLWVMTILLLLVATTSTSTVSSSDQIYVDSSYAAVTTGASITFPLIPYHVQRSRRGLLTTEDDDDLDAGGNNDRHRHRHRHRRRRREEELLSSDPKQMSALYQGYGTHYVDLWVGSPPQRQTVIVDTGSG